MPESEIATIHEVLDELDSIIETTLEQDSPLGIFAYVYRRTTAKIAVGIDECRFEDNERMERFDVAFAKMYIDAFWRFRKNEPVPFSWKVAFEAAENRDAIIMQHLLLGMNAHINYDLGIAAAEVAPGGQIDDLRGDFMLVNDLLAELVDEIQLRISRVSPLMFLLDLIGERDDEAVVNFSLEKARGFAWNAAENLAYAEKGEQEEIIQSVDETIAGLGNLVGHPPGFLLPKVLSVIHFFEAKNTRRVIEGLRIED